jgi:predicted Rossmann fold nucleotide-binding protein DprA/Smf involved in DNA uptake
MKLAVVGSRTITDYQVVREILGNYAITQIVSGGATGIDSLAEQFSASIHLTAPKIFLPDWKQYGKSAGFIRNKDIVDYADAVVAIWDGISKGTKHSVDYAKKQGKQVDVWIVDLELGIYAKL